MSRQEWFKYFEDIYANSHLYIYNIGYFDYRIRKSAEGKTENIFSNRTLHFVVGGKGTLVLGGKAHSVKAGDVFSMPSNEPFAFYPDEQDPWRYYWFNLAGNGVADLCRQMGIDKEHPIIQCDRMDEICLRFDELLDSEFNYGEFYYRALATLYNIVSYFVKEADAPAERLHSSTIVGQAKEIILRNYSQESFSVSQIHKMVHVSEPYLRRVFKRETGKTLSAFLINCRLSKAASYLCAGDYTVSELCYLTGYKDNVYFVREFKKKHGVPPQKYRRLFLMKKL